jgi:hypothetical protein
MRHLALAFVLFLTSILPLRADSAAITATINQQIEAFQADDFERAFEFASPTIQQIFRSAENFGQMVRQGYPMVWRPAKVRFLELRRISGSLWQRVQVVDQQGQVHVLDYQMINGPDGWRINAVQLLKAPGAAA